MSETDISELHPFYGDQFNQAIRKGLSQNEDSVRTLPDGSLVWCSDWQRYSAGDPGTKVLCIEARCDIDVKDPKVFPTLIGDRVCAASEHDNRACCFALHKFAEWASSFFADRHSGLVCCCLWTDGQYSGECSWLKSAPAGWSFVSLYAEYATVRVGTGKSFAATDVGHGVIVYDGDPASEVLTNLGQYGLKLQTHQVKTYPDNLRYTPAETIMNVVMRSRCLPTREVSRIGIPVYCPQLPEPGCQYNPSMKNFHGSYMIASLEDIDSLIECLCCMAQKMDTDVCQKLILLPKDSIIHQEKKKKRKTNAKEGR